MRGNDIMTVLPFFFFFLDTWKQNYIKITSRMKKNKNNDKKTQNLNYKWKYTKIILPKMQVLWFVTQMSKTETTN
jgi:hypothetical protein